MSQVPVIGVRETAGGIAGDSRRDLATLYTHRLMRF